MAFMAFLSWTVYVCKALGISRCRLWDMLACEVSPMCSVPYGDLTCLILWNIWFTTSFSVVFVVVEDRTCHMGCAGHVALVALQ